MSLTVNITRKLTANWCEIWNNLERFHVIYTLFDTMQIDFFQVS